MKADQHVEDGQIRAEMTALAIEGRPHFRLSLMELEQEGNTYTYQTLERLKSGDRILFYRRCGQPFSYDQMGSP